MAKKKQFGPIFSSTDAKKNIYRVSQNEIDNLKVPGPPNRYIPHMPLDKTQDLSQNK